MISTYKSNTAIEVFAIIRPSKAIFLMKKTNFNEILPGSRREGGALHLTRI
jgi:hypothetical protein